MKDFTKIIFFTLLTLIINPLDSFAQIDISPLPTDTLMQMQTFNLDSIFVLPSGQLVEFDELTKKSYYASIREYFNYRIANFKHNQEVFEYQLYSSKIIFLVVIFLVVVGVYFSGVQFHNSMKWKSKKPEDTKDDKTEIEASLQGIKVSSPILGVIILVISLMFFYLYLIHVYPINEVG